MIINNAGAGVAASPTKHPQPMKKFIARFWRHNPQLQNGGYATERVIEARTLASATNKAKRIEKCAYGAMWLRIVLPAKTTQL